MLCPHSRFDNPDNVLVCRRCGETLNRQQAPAAGIKPGEHEPPQRQCSPSGSNRLILILAIACVSLAVALYAAAGIDPGASLSALIPQDLGRITDMLPDLTWTG
jgi:hypothetical protein